MDPVSTGGRLTEAKYMDAVIDKHAIPTCISKNPPDPLKNSTIDQPTPPNPLDGF